MFLYRRLDLACHTRLDCFYSASEGRNSTDSQNRDAHSGSVPITKTELFPPKAREFDMAVLPFIGVFFVVGVIAHPWSYSSKPAVEGTCLSMSALIVKTVSMPPAAPRVCPV